MPLPFLALPAFFAAMAAVAVPILVQVVTMIGFGLITYTGVTLALDQLESILISHLNSLPTDVLQIIFLAGADSAVGILFGAASSVAGWRVATKANVVPTWIAPGTGTITKGF